MVNTNRNNTKTQFWVDLRILARHFNSSSKINECFMKILGDDKSTDYFVKTLYDWIEQKREAIDDDKFLATFDEATSVESLSFNININFMKLSFNQAVNDWLIEGGDLDDVIVKNLTFECYKEVIDGLLEMMKQIFDSPINFAKLTFGTEEDDDFDAYSDENNIFRMPNENNNRLN